MFGGFILHFLLCNYLTVLLKPSREKDVVDTAADIVNRDMHLYLKPSQAIYVQIFANSPDPIYKELSKRVIVAKSSRGYHINFSRLREGLKKVGDFPFRG